MRLSELINHVREEIALSKAPNGLAIRVMCDLDAFNGANSEWELSRVRFAFDVSLSPEDRDSEDLEDLGEGATEERVHLSES